MATTDDLEASRRRALRVGANVLCLTPTHYYLGRVVNFDALAIVLEQAGWVPSLGRHHRAILHGELEEYELHGEALTEVTRAGTVVIEWRHPLPKKPKPE